jgi:gas vesicle protein
VERKNKSVKAHSKGFIKGTLIGAVIGAVAALLLAPKSGKETQADLKRQAKKVVKDADERIVEMESDLKLAARELRGEAYEESQRLITRAEILKNDLQDSATRMSKPGHVSRPEAMGDAKRLVGEGSAVLQELERMTKHIMSTSSQSSKRGKDGDGGSEKEK